MDIEKFRTYCLAKKGVTESFPFDNTTLVMKVLDKMFALGNLDGDLNINLKCHPDKAIELREQYPAVKPGYHMNKKHWNTIVVDGSIATGTIQQWIDDSYNLVVSKMTKKQIEDLKTKR
ncbi:MAG: MmcQ/YjbR family DNA-binding protein [Bacteroidota bacterium]